MASVWRFLSSVKLTVVLLLLMAVVAIPGTIVPAEVGRYELFYQSVWFRALLLVLFLNLLVCTLKTLHRNLHDAEQVRARLLQVETSAAFSASVDDCKRVLRSKGYHVRQLDTVLWAWRGRPGRWGSTLVHCSLLLIMLGAIWGERGFVGTLTTYLGSENRNYFDWQTQSEKPLGFALRVDHFQVEYYPITLRFELLDVASGAQSGPYVLKEGESLDVPQRNLRLQAKSFSPDARELTLGVYGDGGFIRDYLVSATGERFGAVANPGVQVQNLQFRDPILKQMKADLSILEQGQQVLQQRVQVNRPLTWRGVTIFLLAYNRDKFGNWSTGFQLSSDPGEGLVWLASILLCLGLAAAFFLPYRSLGIRCDQQGGVLLVTHGFRGESGREQLQQLREQLFTDEAPPM